MCYFHHHLPHSSPKNQHKTFNQKPLQDKQPIDVKSIIIWLGFTGCSLSTCAFSEYNINISQSQKQKFLRKWKNKKQKSRLRIIYVCKTFGCYSITTTTPSIRKKNKYLTLAIFLPPNFPFFLLLEKISLLFFVRQHEH